MTENGHKDRGAQAGPGEQRSAGVGVFLTESRATEPQHELQEHAEIARRLAALKGLGYGGVCTASDPRPCSYFMPVETLGRAAARALGIRSEDDLFGGVVPHDFVATKAITHPLVSPEAAAPDGWSEAFPRRVQKAVLAGYTAFSREDALRAGAELLKRGDLRLKPVLARGGAGQALVRDIAELERELDGIEAGFASGLVLEENLGEVVTYSVGQVRVAELVASYYGTQRLTCDNAGSITYGGSDLVVVRGGFDALLQREIPATAREAVAQARIYDDAASDCFEGFLASRRNYDVAQGMDGAGTPRSGVLEQSWRVGGASTAEILALEAFRSDPSLVSVRASSVERYGEEADAPEGAAIFYRGSDAQVGPIVKYALVDA